MKYMIITLGFIFLPACKHTLFVEEGHLRKEWVVNVLSEPYLKTRLFQKSPAVLTNEFVIQGDSLRGIRAYDRKNGNLQWFFPISGGVESGVLHYGERLFFGGADGFFYCLEVTTGRVLWKFYTGSENLGSPFVSKNTVYFLTSKEKVYALHTRTGKTIWVYSGDFGSGVLRIRGVSRPFVDSHKVYAGFGDGSFRALNKATGKLVWKVQLSKKTDVFKDSDAHPVVLGNLLYVSSYSGGIFCLNKLTGQVKWRYQAGSYSSPSIQGRKLYYSSTQGSVISLDRFSGSVLWKHKVPKKKGLASRPVIYKSILIYGLSSGGLEVLSQRTGTLKDQLNLFKGVTVSPVVDPISREMFVMSQESWLYKFKLLF